jgi:hypothetical protein
VGGGRSPIRSGAPRWHRALGAALGAAALAAAAPGTRPPQPPAAQLEAYTARRPKSVIDLQPFRTSRSIALPGGRGTVTLIDLNPAVHAWLLLNVETADGASEVPYHLENPDPDGQRVTLEDDFPDGLVLRTSGREQRCALWSGSGRTALEDARTSGRVYAPLCGARLYLRNPVRGHKTALEWTTDFLRDYVWEGEAITDAVNRNLFRDAFLHVGKVLSGTAAPRPRPPGAPGPARLDAPHVGQLLEPAELGIALEGAGDRLEAGRWYAVRGVPGVYVSALRPDFVAPDIVAREGRRVSPLDPVESEALVYLVAFDLGQLELGFAMGTEHPRVEWSDRVRESVRDPSLPGPDGIDTLAPLVMTGRLSPSQVPRAVATFAGGFKRRHGAFRYSELALRNMGSHYGFLESGVILSKLQPGLATLLVWDDGGVDLRTWSDADEPDLWRILHARQNGVPIVEPDPATGGTRPGSRVRQWGAGNWSGSQDSRFRTLRSGVCLQESDEGRFLVYGYFSSATPSAMARVFEAYGCRYAMHLDMNALEHTYLAIYRRDADRLVVEHLIEGMDALDESEGDRVVPRFLGYSDNRDFFYLLRRETP